MTISKFERDPVERALQHYLETAEPPVIMPESAKQHEISGQDFVVIYAAPYIRAVYEMFPNGALNPVTRWPEELDEIYGTRRKAEVEPVRTKFAFGDGIREMEARSKSPGSKRRKQPPLNSP